MYTKVVIDRQKIIRKQFIYVMSHT